MRYLAVRSDQVVHLSTRCWARRWWSASARKRSISAGRGNGQQGPERDAQKATSCSSSAASLAAATVTVLTSTEGAENAPLRVRDHDGRGRGLGVGCARGSITASSSPYPVEEAEHAARPGAGHRPRRTSPRRRRVRHTSALPSRTGTMEQRARASPSRATGTALCSRRRPFPCLPLEVFDNGYSNRVPLSGPCPYPLRLRHQSDGKDGHRRTTR